MTFEPHQKWQGSSSNHNTSPYQVWNPSNFPNLRYCVNKVFRRLTPGDPRWPLTPTRNDRALPLTITHVHTKYELHPTFLTWDIVLRRFSEFDPWWMTFDLPQKHQGWSTQYGQPTNQVWESWTPNSWTPMMGPPTEYYYDRPSLLSICRKRSILYIFP